MEVILVKICAMGLTTKMVGKTISELQPLFHKLKAQCDFNVCGEGGEYESAVLDCPLFKHRLVIEDAETIELGNDYSPVSYLYMKAISKQQKTPDDILKD